MKRKKMMTGFILAMIVVLNGCHSYRNVNVKQKFQEGNQYYLTEPSLHVGDKIKFKLETGQEGEMTVANISSLRITGANNVTIPLDQLKSLEKLDVSKPKTGAAVVGGATVAVAVVVVALSFAIGGVLAVAAAG